MSVSQGLAVTVLIINKKEVIHYGKYVLRKMSRQARR